MPKKHIPKYAAYKTAYTDQLLAGLSPGNRDAVRMFVQQYSHRKISHRLNLVQVLAKLDRYLQGHPIHEASADRLRDFIPVSSNAEYQRSENRDLAPFLQHGLHGNTTNAGCNSSGQSAF